MTIYEKQNNIGESWYRSSDGKILSCNIALSSFGIKYRNIDYDLYSNITDNHIKDLDVIQDVLLVKTISAFFIDKFYINDDNIPVPILNYNNSHTIPKNCSLDYWFDEPTQKIYTFFGGMSALDNKFNFEIYEFDILNNLYDKKRHLAFDIVSEPITTVDGLKVCYNQDTTNFNISLVFSTSSLSDVNLLSWNVKTKNTMILDSLNLVLPNQPLITSRITNVLYI